MTPGQARAARALLKLGVREVAAMAKVTPNTVSRVEQETLGPRGPQPVTIEAIKRAYESSGVEFIPENGGGAGVRLRKATLADQSKVLGGEDGIIENKDM